MGHRECSDCTQSPGLMMVKYQFEDTIGGKLLPGQADLPLSGWILRSGYGDTPQAILYENITELVNVGVVGINIEDSVIRCRQRRLCDWMMFSQTLRKS
ncbi:isocitrate lyase/phosphoenolpyruvate mutase family protein [Vibrio chagasii]|nr:isocitrate lyase/phosphoenolpyruvate mutase family protein [Vibrio chagasii]